MAKSPHPTPSAPISSPTAHEPPQPSDGRAHSSFTNWDHDQDPTNPFALVPAASYNTLVQLQPLTSRLLRGRRRLRRLLLPAQPGPDALHALLTGPVEPSDGSPRFARAFAAVVFAVLANHVRRMALPALGVSGFGAPIATLKLAAGSPAIFLKEEMEIGILGRNAGWEGASKVVGDIVGGFAVRGAVAGSPRRWGSEADKAMVVMAVVYCVWVLGCAEYVHARAVHTTGAEGDPPPLNLVRHPEGPRTPPGAGLLRHIRTLATPLPRGPVRLQAGARAR
ncbi:uncharacterized protein LY79DRAFT_559936 [Colletotrichum navitas]|uniref:Uncharacterized protein n=1 Tax=Colletotrichum navitas TaxID=681940 RepID=A0AAD8PVS5_9PEZI|nr:uncharacterized protein LY79DRAFT_559936 [Colletotrichum navitas]KAK1584970.1 hypothetical protein LY79DRAFT_559936 [Colletotrichum navitas]